MNVKKPFVEIIVTIESTQLQVILLSSLQDGHCEGQLTGSGLSMKENIRQASFLSKYYQNFHSEFSHSAKNQTEISTGNLRTAISFCSTLCSLRKLESNFRLLYCSASFSLKCLSPLCF